MNRTGSQTMDRQLCLPGGTTSVSSTARTEAGPPNQQQLADS